MKKRAVMALCLIMLLSCLPLSTQAASGDETTIKQVVGALGIITGDQQGNLNLSSSVSRAEFAKMMVCASNLKSSISPSGNASPFKDVPYTHWAASYIKTAVNQGWLTGYLDGTYRPGNPLTAAEAATAVLKLLGYTSSDFSGSFPEAQMALFSSTGLSDCITAGANTMMTRQSCMRLFYNLLSVKTKDGSQKYIQVLGHKLDADGNPDYNDLLQGSMDGPLVYTNGNLKETLGFTPTTVFRNGATSTIEAIQPFDVLYYSSAQKTVWVYARRITGVYESAAPNKDAPTNVTLSGVSYAVSNSMARAQLGSSGGLAIGSNVTLLLGKNGDVVAAYDAGKLSTELVGLVTDKGTSSYTAGNGSSYTATTLSITGVDGQNYTVQTDNTESYVSAGSLVRVTYGSSGVSVSTLSRNGISGKVTMSTIGGIKAATDIKILDVCKTVATRVYMSRINGLALESGDVSYYELNAQGEVETLILDNITGDAYTYGIVLSANEIQKDMSLSGSYTLLINGQQTSISTVNSIYNVNSGPARFIRDGSQISSIQMLTKIKNITAVNELSVKTDSECYSIWDHAAVYVYQNGVYTQLDRSELNSGTYYIQAFYDRSDSNGGRVRIIIASPR